MKKIFIGVAVSIIVILVVAVFAAAESFADDLNDEEKQQIGSVVEGVAKGEIGKEVKNYVEKFVNKRGIQAENIKNVEKIDFNDLPKEVNIENVDDTNLAIYQVDYDNEAGGQDKVFMITYSVEQLNAQGDLIIAHDKRQFLSFGFSGEIIESRFLNSATGVETSLEKGYVMVREGSITAISTNLETLEGEGILEIIVYKNGIPVRFGNTITVDSSGVKKDYDVQSKDVVSFEPGDVISAYVKAEGNMKWKDVITMIEITTIN